LPAQLENKNIYLILGFLRSGTSVIARSLQALNIDLGNKMVDYDDNCLWNPTGFFEDKEIIYDIHAKLYAALHQPKRSIRLIDKKTLENPALNPIKISAIELLSHRFQSTDHFGFKDPSIAKILPFWHAIFDTLKIKDHYVIAVRHPLSSAQSYSNLTGSDIELSLLLWLMHLVPALEDSLGRRTLVVSYELMMQNPHAELNRIKNQLQLTTQEDPHAIAVFANEFLNKNLHHHKHEVSHLKTHPAALVVPLCNKLYDLLMRLARDEIALQDEAFTSTWENIKEELAELYPLYCYLDVVLRRNKSLKREMHKMKKSIVWKLLHPLHLIDNKFREKRMLKRARHRITTAYE
jgi:hypothetical protein